MVQSAAAANPQYHTATFAQLVVGSMALYSIWAVFYYFKVRRCRFDVHLSSWQGCQVAIDAAVCHEGSQQLAVSSVMLLGRG